MQEHLLVCTVAEDSHLHIQCDGIVSSVKRFQAICRNQIKVIERIEAVERGRRGCVRCPIVDKPACDVRVQPRRDLIKEAGVHAPNHRVILTRIILHGDQDAVALSAGNVDHICIRRLSPDPVDFDNPHSVALDPEVLTGKSTHIGEVNQISFPGFHWRLQVSSVVHQCTVRHRLGAGGVGHADELFQKIWQQIMIPVGESQNQLLIILTQVRVIRVRDGESLAQTIRILATGMAVVPVGTSLIDLR